MPETIRKQEASLYLVAQTVEIPSLEILECLAQWNIVGIKSTDKNTVSWYFYSVMRWSANVWDRETDFLDDGEVFL